MAATTSFLRTAILQWWLKPPMDSMDMDFMCLMFNECIGPWAPKLPRAMIAKGKRYGKYMESSTWLNGR